MMGFFSSLFERRGLDLTDVEQWRNLGLTAHTASGVSVTADNALRYAAVLACVRVLAETVASLPLITYERDGEGSKMRADNFYLYRLLHDAPNEMLTSFEFRELLQTHLLLWGNAYAEIDFNGRGQTRALWPLRPDKMLEVRGGDDGLEYVYVRPDHKIEVLPGYRVLHLRGLGTNGLTGISPIGLARQAIGLGIAAEEYGARFFGNDARPGGVLQHPGRLGDEAFTRLRESWESRHQGLSRSHRMAILEEGMTFEEIGIPPEDAQFLETRKFQVAEIARIYRVPPHMIGDLERATFSNIEHQSLEFVIHSIRPWLVRWEQTLQERLLTSRERSRYFVEFLVDGLLRGDTQSRYQAYAVGRQNGWLSANDIRRLENMNPVENGDLYLVPLNMIPVDQAATPPTPLEGGRAASPSLRGDKRELRTVAGRQRLIGVHFSVFEDVAGRVLRREANDVGNAARRLLSKRTVPDFVAWLDEFYEDHKQFTMRQWLATLFSFAALIAGDVGEEIDYELDEDRLAGFVRAYAERLGERQAARSRARLDAILEELGEDALPEIERTLENWRETRPAGVANEETVRSGNAIAKLVYGAAGIRALRWVTAGSDTCPYCSRLDGVVVDIQQPFLPAGVPFAEDAPDGALVPSRDIGHPPAHRGCDCMIIAG